MILQRMGLPGFFGWILWAVLWVSHTWLELVCNLSLNNPKLYCFFWSPSGTCAIMILSQTQQAWGSRPMLTFAMIPSPCDTDLSSACLGRTGLLCHCFPGPSPSLLDSSRSWVIRLAGSILGSDKPWLECKGQRAMFCALLSCGSVPLWSGGPDVFKGL